MVRWLSWIGLAVFLCVTGCGRQGQAKPTVVVEQAPPPEPEKKPRGRPRPRATYTGEVPSSGRAELTLLVDMH